ncbi:nuclear receptor-binding protein-like isoform X2 [Hydractinia symbiolongicarpus]|uniref:nuclear receptor-binding protein-like isoform X2 n=1 Tax=Hydractinia symbiolongicarpus TaxID=13093 RepID=UPI00254C4903|nr:nuclear receptor-binding protein-like isoform X2 [Hydractinia symbiolongicarpus]
MTECRPGHPPSVKNKMANQAAGGQQVADVNQTEEPDTESDDDEVVETSPCGRWEKHKKELSQRNVPGIDSSFLAMDTEEGVEVVWNEVRFSERKSWKNKEEVFKRIFENLTQLDHPNIVKFHKYWVDLKGEHPRLIFIGEYMTSGSLRQFLKKTKANIKSLNIKGWKRWCKQILSALSYLHGCDPPIVHGNLNCDTIFIQHNGLMKIGTVAPDAINNYVKTYKHQRRNMHFIAPEYDGESLFSALSSEDYGQGVNGRPVNCAADIYSFGIVALEMATLQWAEATTSVTPEMIQTAITNLDDPNQQDFICKCLEKNPLYRPSVRELLKHPLMLEVYTLKVLAGHALVDSDSNDFVKGIDEIEERDSDRVMAEIVYPDQRENIQWKFSKVQPQLELEKFLEEIKTGLYPLTGMENSKPKKDNRPQLNASRPKSPEDVVNSSQGSEEEEQKEVRLIIQMTCTAKQMEDGSGQSLSLLLRLEDKMNRQLSCKVGENETPMDLAMELVSYGLISEADREKVANKIDEALKAPA